MNLFDQNNEEQGECYVIDTSSFNLINDHPEHEKIWECIFKLIEQDRIRIPVRVKEELLSVDPAAHAKLKPHFRKIVVQKSTELLREAGQLSYKYPNPCGTRGTYPGPADPYLIALAKLNKHTLVTDEKLQRRRIPKICQREGVVTITLAELINRK